mmetsp:Transcript_75956/g.162946  ORF Transcript_75956/g.162946 Transcript_75956/m.162946 type:complete len:104 (+) Transcript_75956:696-1007(+)
MTRLVLGVSLGINASRRVDTNPTSAFQPSCFTLFDASTAMSMSFPQSLVGVVVTVVVNVVDKNGEVDVGVYVDDGGFVDNGGVVDDGGSVDDGGGVDDGGCVV